MTVKLRQVGNSRTLTVPSGIKVTGKEYTVKNASKTIIFTPIAKKKNILTCRLSDNLSVTVASFMERNDNFQSNLLGK